MKEKNIECLNWSINNVEVFKGNQGSKKHNNENNNIEINNN